MSWSAEQQLDAEMQLAAFAAEFTGAYEAWESAAIGGNSDQGEAHMADVLRRWRAFTNTLQSQSDSIIENQGVMSRVGELLTELGDQKGVLKRLQSEAGTRANQADSLNPKIRQSPFTNILGLQRTFRDSTRVSILIASIVFGILAIGTRGFLVYRVVDSGGVVVQSPTRISGGLFGNGFA